MIRWCEGDVFWVCGWNVPEGVGGVMVCGERVWLCKLAAWVCVRVCAFACCVVCMIRSVF